jgi:hypothetical protein
MGGYGMSKDPSEHQPSPNRAVPNPAVPKSPKQESLGHAEKIVGETRAFSEEEQRELRSESPDDFDFALQSDFQSPALPERRNPILGEYVILDRLGAGGMGQVSVSYTHLTLPTN